MSRYRWHWDNGCQCEHPVVTSATKLGNLCIRCLRERDPSKLSYAQWKAGR